MVVPKHQDGKSDDSTIKFQKVVDVVANTRQAGGQQIDETVVPKIIVDIREFRSELPCLIHHRGIEVAPVTITVSFERCVAKIDGIHILFCFLSGRLAIIF